MEDAARASPMKKLLLLLPVLVIGVLAWWLYQRGNAPLEVPFSRVVRETLVSTLSTNGKVEPVEWVSVNAVRSGVVDSVPVHRGSRVARGEVLAELGASEAKSELDDAEARLAQARASLEEIQRGGRATDLAALDGELAEAKLELAAAESDRASLERLAAKQAATKQDVTDAARRVERAQAQIRSLEKRRAALTGQSDRVAAEAKVKEAETAVETAKRHVEQTVIRAPIAGTVYDVAARPGAYLNPGDPVAKIGQMSKVRVRVYVDEPELGRVAAAMQVTIAWDALPGKKWLGAVERMPSEITALGSREVGEVVCIIENPDSQLPPGANVNAEIRSGVAENALSIPREALRRQGSQAGVFLLQGNKVVWRPVTVGVSTINRAQVLQGLAEGDAVAVPGSVTLADGAVVRPVFR